jgi:AhpC/TSA family
LERLHQTYKEHGLAILAINHGDSAEAIRKFVANGRYSLDIGSDRDINGQANAVGSRYHVQSYPTNYLIDQNGKVVWRGVGFGAETKQGLIDALAKLGLR